jgi:hypothetical protein
MDIRKLLEKKETELEVSKSSGGANSARAEAVEALCDFMGDDPTTSRFGYWLGRTRQIQPDKLHVMMKRCRKDAKNPQALFNYLLKNPDKV